MLRQELAVLPTPFLLFLPFEDLGLSTSAGAMDPGELSGQLQTLGVDVDDTCAA